MSPKDLLRAYKVGLSFKDGDALRPKVGADLPSYAREIVDQTVVVLDQSFLAPHQYTVVGERLSPRTPSDRFVKFEINGHDWEKVD